MFRKDVIGFLMLAVFSAGSAFMLIPKPEWRDDKTQVSPYELAKTIERVRGCEDCEASLFIHQQDDRMISRRENWAVNSNHNYHMIEEFGKKRPELYKRYNPE